jgi:hypothetical protein
LNVEHYLIVGIANNIYGNCLKIPVSYFEKKPETEPEIIMPPVPDTNSGIDTLTQMSGTRISSALFIAFLFGYQVIVKILPNSPNILRLK